MRELYQQLGDLAAAVRSIKANIEDEMELIKSYHTVMAELYHLGWDGVLDTDAKLPDEDMPDAYRKRHLKV